MANKMDVVAPLAGQLVQILAPFLPYLVKVGETVSERAAEHLENKGSALAANVWARLRGKLAEKPAAQEAVADLAAQPADEDARAAVRIQLRKLLADDPGLQRDLETLLKQAESAGTTTVTVTASGERSVAIGHDVRGSTITTGDQKQT
jgi:hypothetical protein